MRPQLVPGMRPLWRDRTSLQIGTRPGRAVVVTDLDGEIERASSLLRRLDGHHTEHELLAYASRLGMDRALVTELLEGLHRAGNVVSRSPARDLPTRLPPTTRRLLLREAAALGVEHGERSGSILRGRADSLVTLHTSGGIGPLVANALGRSGVGRVHVVVDDERPRQVRLSDVLLGGVRPEDEGESYRAAVLAAIAREAPAVNTRAPAPHQRPDVAVLSHDRVWPATEAVRYVDLGIPHLPIIVREGAVTVGPLVIPGLTGCLSCVETHRTDRDPAWPLLSRQLSHVRDEPEPLRAVHALHAASLAASQILDLLDGDRPKALGASIEIGGPDGRPRWRTWRPHPECACARRIAG